MMRRSTVVVVTLALLGTGVAVMGQSSDALASNLLGTWKLNVEKSKFSPGPPAKSQISTWERWEGGLKNTVDGIDAQGKPTHIEQVANFDGKDYPRRGATVANTTRAFKRIDDRTYESIEKTDGKVTTTTRSVSSRDGKTRTLTTTGKDVQGRAVNNVGVWEKE
jgi:hypothetical protein